MHTISKQRWLPRVHLPLIVREGQRADTAITGGVRVEHVQVMCPPHLHDAVIAGHHQVLSVTAHDHALFTEGRNTETYHTQGSVDARLTQLKPTCAHHSLHLRTQVSWWQVNITGHQGGDNKCLCVRHVPRGRPAIFCFSDVSLLWEYLWILCIYL